MTFELLLLLQLQLLQILWPITTTTKVRDSRGDNLVVVDKLGVRDRFTMTFKDMQWFLGMSQVVVVNTVIWYLQNTTQISNKKYTKC